MLPITLPLLALHSAEGPQSPSLPSKISFPWRRNTLPCICVYGMGQGQGKDSSLLPLQRGEHEERSTLKYISFITKWLVERQHLQRTLDSDPEQVLGLGNSRKESLLEVIRVEPCLKPARVWPLTLGEAQGHESAQFSPADSPFLKLTAICLFLKYSNWSELGPHLWFYFLGQRDCTQLPNTILPSF